MEELSQNPEVGQPWNVWCFHLLVLIAQLVQKEQAELVRFIQDEYLDHIQQIAKQEVGFSTNHPSTCNSQSVVKKELEQRRRHRAEAAMMAELEPRRSSRQEKLQALEEARMHEVRGKGLILKSCC
jgi:hypothetical protein